MEIHNKINLHRNNTGLPIDQYEKELLYLVEKHKVTIVVGETGSGKSTRIPVMLYNSGVYNTTDDNIERIIAITQPRRVAAIQLAQKVAEDLSCNVGTLVGYAVRFKDVTTTNQTLIKFMTEGLLLRELLVDPLLRKYSVIVLDEVHERNLNTDILLGMLKCILIRRDDLRIVISSATLDLEPMVKFFTYDEEHVADNRELREPGVLLIPGKSYPIKILYREKPVANYMDCAIETTIQIHEKHRLTGGKILIFVTGLEEVNYVCDKLLEYAEISTSRLDIRKLLVIPFHASLHPEEIARAFNDYGTNTRVCIVSTNVAETSLTIDHIKFVIDCGFVKLRTYDSNTGVDMLVRVPVSKSSSKQRAGRAGRTNEGIVYRLYQEDEYEKLKENSIPELQRSSLTETVMLLKCLGVKNLQQFPLISPMPFENLVNALEILYALQALEEDGSLTSSGRIMATLNLDARLSKVLVSLESSSCTLEVCKIAAVLQVKDIFVKPGKHITSLWSNSHLTKMCVSEGDLISYLNIYNGFMSNEKSKRWAEKRNLNYTALLNATEISAKLESQLRKGGLTLNSCTGRLETIQRSLVSGLFLNAAYLHACGDYRTIRGDQTVYIHPSSVYSEVTELPKYVVFVEILNTTKLYIRHLMAVEESWLLDAAPHFWSLAPQLNSHHSKGDQDRLNYL